MTSRIPQPFIDDVLSRTDIVALIDRYVPLKRSGINYQACCPFHQEKSPSFSVNQTKQFYYCFGCGASGNAISFIMNYLHYSFLDALEHLATPSGLTLPNRQAHQAQQQSKQSLYTLLDQVTTFYQHQLTQHAEAKHYLIETRGLSKNVIQLFRLGYAPSGWEGLLKQFSADQQADLIKTGMVIKRDELDCYDRFRRRIMFPIRDRRGQVIAFGGRILTEGTPKYLNSPETPIFHKGSELYGLYELQQRRRKIDGMMVVEGYMDVIALAQQGIHYAVATLGTAVTAMHLQRLFAQCDKILFCFDGDQAGRRAAWRVVEVALPMLQERWQLSFLFLPDNEDPDSLIRREGKAPFEKRLTEQSKTLSEFLLTHFSEQVNMESLEGRARFAHLVMNAISQVTSPLIKKLFLEAISTHARIDVTTLSASQKRDPSLTSQPHSHQPRPASSRPNPSPLTPFRRLVALLLQTPSLVNYCEALPTIPGEGGELLETLIERIKQNPTLSTGALIEYWRDQKQADYLTQLANTQATLLEGEAMINEFQGLILLLQRKARQTRIEQLHNKLKQQVITDEEKLELKQLLERAT